MVRIRAHQQRVPTDQHSAMVVLVEGGHLYDIRRFWLRGQRLSRLCFIARLG
jgi:hypothetical protein